MFLLIQKEDTVATEIIVTLLIRITTFIIFDGMMLAHFYCRKSIYENKPAQETLVREKK
jgi:hypothetical protein